MSSLRDMMAGSGRKADERRTLAARRIVMAVVMLFLALSARATLADAGDVYSPCWAKDECLDVNVGGAAVSQPNRGLCDNQHCFEQGAGCPSGQGKCYANPPPANLAVSVGGKARVIDIGDYIAVAYNYGVGIVGILAGTMFVVGGFQYLTAGGDSSKVSKAKERIRDALVGLLLTFGAYVILNTINPDILKLQMPKVPLVKRVLFVACQYFERQVPCGQPFTLVKIEGIPSTAPADQQYRVARASDVDSGTGATTTSCIGKSCSRAGSNDATQRCKRRPGGTVATSTNTSTNASGSAGVNITVPDACLPRPVEPFQCVDCQRHGNDCRGSGPNSDCCGGFCSSGAVRGAMGDFGALVANSGYSGTGSSLLEGFCTNGGNGVQCGVNAECFSQHCANTGGTGFGGQCVSGLVGSICNDDPDCAAGNVCVEESGIHVCLPPQVYGPCEERSDCPSGSECRDNRCTPHTSCETDANCPAGLHCWAPRHICKTNGPGSVCHSDADCSDIPNGRGFCYDGAIQNRSGIAGICVESMGGAGCDPGHDDQCQRFNSMSRCRRMQSNWGNDGTCTYAGTAGMPCVGPGFAGVGGTTGVSNTCNSGMTCPQGVFVCVEPPISC